MRNHEIDAARMAIGAACAIFDGRGDVLLVRHAYGRLNWELPGGGSQPGEAPDDTARRELLEETGLELEIDRLTNVYFEIHHADGPMLHFAFRCRWDPSLAPVPSSPEITDVGFWPTGDLPTPISDFTERRIHDAAGNAPASVMTIDTRRWRP